MPAEAGPSPVQPPTAERPVVIVGAGLAGLCCAIELGRRGLPWLLLEAGDAVGGRVRSDTIDGFTLDRGFQVLLTAYPEARRLLDYEALDLRAFEPGALIRRGGSFHRVSDPLRRPQHALASLRAPVGTLADKARIGLLGARLRTTEAHRLVEGPDVATVRHLADLGFSDEIVDHLLRPLFAGIQLDWSLATSSRAFTFVLAMLARGDNAVPAAGIEAIPRQLAGRLDPARIRLHTRVTAIDDGGVTVADVGHLPAGAVVIATDGPTAARLDAAVADPGSKTVGCVWFAADSAPVTEPVLLLDADRSGPVNNLTVMSRVAPTYAPPGAELVAASVVPAPGARVDVPDDQLIPDVRDQLRGWFGPAVDGWRHLRTDRITHAQPRQPAGRLTPPGRPVGLGPGRYVCGDHRDDASINGAMVSGRRAAEAVAIDALGRS